MCYPCIDLRYICLRKCTALPPVLWYCSTEWTENPQKHQLGQLVFEMEFIPERSQIQSKNINPLTPNDHYSGRTAPLTSKRCILYIYSTNTGTEYFKHGIYSPFFSLQIAVCFKILTYLVHVLFTFYIQDVLKLKKK